MAAGSDYHCGSVKEEVVVRAPRADVWAILSRVSDMTPWASGVAESASFSPVRRGVGSTRRLVMDDGSVIREKVVGWREGRYLSYVALDGLPLETYHATIGVRSSGGSARVTWQSFFGARSGRRGIAEAARTLRAFYAESLSNLKGIAEAGRR